MIAEICKDYLEIILKDVKSFYEKKKKKIGINPKS
jgi:hypothetical protein